MRTYMHASIPAHQMAIQQMPSDEFEENHVMSELQPGYTCNGKLVRAAYVIVSSG